MAGIVLLAAPLTVVGVRAQPASFAYQPPVVGTVIEYGDGFTDVLLSRVKQVELWCTVFGGKRVLTRSTARSNDSDSNFIDGAPVRYRLNGSTQEIMAKVWPLRPGKSFTIEGRLFHKKKVIGYVERTAVGAYVPKVTLAGHAVAALSYRVQYLFDADTYLGLRVAFSGFYVPAWRIGIVQAQDGAWSNGRNGRVTSALKRIYIPGIVGKPIPIPKECLNLTG